MLLVQPPLHPSSMSLMPLSKQLALPSHRRNPSAPAAVIQSQVQPTKIPGLLSISKPVPARPPRHSTPRQHKSRPLLPQQQRQQEVPSPERQRGRNNSAKDKSARPVVSKPPRAGHGGRGRQASPSPLPLPEQASTEETVTVSNETKYLSSTISSSKPQPSTPTVLGAPSGKLAKRRNRAFIPFPQSVSTPSVAPKQAKSNQASPPPRTKPVLVPGKPAKSKVNGLPISRSDPALPHFPRGPPRHEVADVFPICDDYDDEEEDSGQERPSTPSPTGRIGNSGARQRATLFSSDTEENGPRTAPVSLHEGVARSYFPSPVPFPSHRQHKRTPSVPTDGVFDLSFNSDNELNVSEMSALFGRASSHRPRYDGSVRSTSTPLRKPDAVFNKFASPMFQNSPSPEQLPPPTFSLAKMKKALVEQAQAN